MSKGTVLVADDDKAIRTVLTQALGRAGFDVRASSTASSLWQWVSNGEGDVIVTDVMMPDQNAFDLIPRIKKLRPDLRQRERRRRLAFGWRLASHARDLSLRRPADAE